MRAVDATVAAYRRAVELRPDDAEAWLACGRCLADADRLADAAAVLGRAVAVGPDWADAHALLADALLGTGRPDAAAAAARRAIAVRPDLAAAHTTLGNVLKDQGQPAAAVAAFARAVELRPDYWQADSNRVYAMAFVPGVTDAQLDVEARRWGQRHADPLSAPVIAHANDRDLDRRLRVGYVSPDFADHVVGRNVLPLLQRHDRAAVEVTCYASVARPDTTTDRFRATADRWRDVAKISDEDLAEQVRRDGIDVLVDLTLHMAGHRLLALARRPAPVQVTFAGFPGGTGVAAIGYRLSDPHLDPPGMSATSVERVLHLRHSFWCYDPLDDRDVPVSPLPAGDGGGVTFGCLNNFCKVNDAVIDLWSRVLAAVPGSRLLLVAAEGSHRSRTADRFAAAGVAGGRVRFVDRQPRRAYLQLYHGIDIGLDTVPYNGHTTSLDSLWMGVPVVTLVGNTIVGRAGVSQLTNLGRPEWIADDADAFVSIAIGLATDRRRLAEERRTLRPRMAASSLMDADAFARGVEAAYRQAWRAWATAGSGPAGRYDPGRDA